MRLGFDPRFVEGVVDLGVRLGKLDAPAYHRAREGCYSAADPEAREAAHQRLEFAYFELLGVGRLMADLLAAEPILSQQIAAAQVVRAVRARDEGAELFVAPEDGRAALAERRRLILALRPESALEPAALRLLFTRELLAVADMVDPSFGYSPELPTEGLGPTHDRMLVERYSALWSASVLGRLARAGRGAQGREAVLERLAQVFAGVPSALLAPFVDGPRPDHGELMAFARAPLGEAAAQGSRCALCGFPSYTRVAGAELGGALVARIQRDFPAWLPERGTCRQCADLYDAKLGAEAYALP